MFNLWRDVHYAARVLSKQPGFTTVAVLVLALGIGVNAAIFSIVNGLLLKPLAGDGSAGKLVGVFNKDRTRPDRYRPFSYPNYVDLRDGAKSFSGVAAYTLAIVGLTEGDTTRRTFGFVISSNYFETLGVKVARGREFSPDEEDPLRATPVVIIGDAYWKRMGSDPDVVGKTVRVNSHPFTVVGVAPEGFTGTSAVIAPDVWLPLGTYEMSVSPLVRRTPTSQLLDRENHSLLVVGRLGPGVGPDEAQREMEMLASRLEQAYPAENKGQTVSLHELSRVSMSDSPQDDSEVSMLGALLFGMSSVVLLIACLNLANLLLARGSARRKEIAIRMAIGGSRWSIVRQLLVEGLLLALLGGAAGLLFSIWGTGLILSSLTIVLPFPVAFNLAPDVRVLGMTLALSVASAVVFALGPAWKLTRPGVVNDLKEQVTERGSRRRTALGRFVPVLNVRNLLVAAQLSLSLALLVTGGLFVRGAVAAAAADPGFPLERGLMVEIDPSLAGYTLEQSTALHKRLIERLRQVPGVEAASFSSLVPFGMITEQRRVERADAPAREADAGQGGGTGSVQAYYYVVGADHARSLGMRVVKGRDFTPEEAEGASARAIALIDEPLAARLWPNPGENPVGQFVRFTARSEAASLPEPIEVVGIVPGIRHDLTDRGPVPHIYVPFSRNTRTWMYYQLRVASGAPGGEAAMMQAVRQEIRTFDERLPVVSMRTFRGHADADILLWAIHTAARMFTTFGAAALLLAVVGIYGVYSYLMARRTREIGIRMALGANRRDVVRLVVGEGAIVTAWATAVGLVAALGIGQLVASMLYEVTAVDPLAFLVAPSVLVMAALAACLVPARRAAGVDPTVALRCE